VTFYFVELHRAIGVDPNASVRHMPAMATVDFTALHTSWNDYPPLGGWPSFDHISLPYPPHEGVRGLNIGVE
jgi:hypothetical protein